MMSSSVVLALLAVGASPPPRAIGVNLDFHVSWSSHIIFVDGFKRARPWVPFVPESNHFDSGAEVPIDRVGMPRKVPFVPAEGGPPQLVRTMMFEEQNGRYPAGTYLFEFKGKGVVSVRGDPDWATFDKGGSYPIDVVPRGGGFEIVIERSDPRDPIRDMHLWLPGFHHAKDPFYPETITRLRGFSVLRPIQTMSVNDGDYPCDNPGIAPQDPRCRQAWKNRPTLDHYTQMRPKGVAAEHMIELANRVQTDIWPGIPHAATDDWIRGMATLLRDRLDPGLKIYVELSNEIWNSSGDYPQHDYFIAVGVRDRLYGWELTRDDADAGRRAYVRRAAQVWRIFEEVFGPQARARLVKVMPGFFGNPWHSDRMMIALNDRKINPRQMKADAMAVGAYFGGVVINNFFERGREKRVSVDEILDATEASLGKASDTGEEGTYAGLIHAHMKLCKKYKLPLIAYEGGQHLVSGRPSPINAKIFAANRHPRMAKIYDKAFDLWFGAGGGLFVVYGFAGRYSHYGAFGHLEYTDQPLEDAPKFQALRSRMQSFGVPLPQPLLRQPLGRRWFYARTGMFPGGGVLIPLE